MSTPHDVHDEAGSPAHATLQTYLTGFILSVILTAIPFWLVMTDVLNDHRLTGAIVVILAFVQVVVHMICFLHMDTKSEGGWTIMALIFTVMILGITLSGSIWVMYHLDSNMMPLSAKEMSQMP